MVGEAIQGLQQQLLFAGNYKSSIQENCDELIKVFQRSFYPTFGIDDLIRFVSEHIISTHIILSLTQKEKQENLLHDSIYRAFEKLVSTSIDKKLLDTNFLSINESINQLLKETEDENILFTKLMGREEGEVLPDYFLGMFKSLMRKHLNSSGRNAQYLYPSFTLPPFIDTEAKSNTIVCYDLLVYYWSAITIPESTRSFGNSLSFVDIKPQGQKHFSFSDRDDNLNKLINLNRDPVQIVFGTIQQMSLGNRTVNKEWISKVKKTFKNDSKRNPVSYWFLWAKERLGSNGILVLRGDHSLAASPEYKEWRKTVSNICNRVYVQAQQYSNQVIYCFIFNEDSLKEGVYFAPSYLEDFATVNEESDDWLTLSSDEYKNFLCLISEKEKSIFNESLPLLDLKNKSWHTDFNKKQLLLKSQLFLKKQKKADTLDLKEDDEVINENQLIKIYVKPFLKKWAFIAKRDTNNWNTAHHYGFNNENPTFALATHKDIGLETVPIQHPPLKSFFDRKQNATVLPQNIYKEDQSYVSNISDWALDRFKQYYISRLPKIEENSSIEPIKEILGLELKNIHKFTNRLPVLNKYVIKLEEVIQDDNCLFEEIIKLLHLLNSKMNQLYKNSSEKKTMINSITQASIKISAAIQKLEKGKMENETKIGFLTKENIFYYCFAILNHSIYRHDYENELKALLPRIPLLNDFWSWSKKGKDLFNAEASKTENNILQFVDIDDEFNEFDLTINTTQKLVGIHEDDLKGEWHKHKIFHLILQEYKERKPLNKDLQTFFNPSIPAINQIDLIKSVKLQSQYFKNIMDILPEKLFENSESTIRLKRRK